MKASLNWVKNMQFSCNNHGIETSIDASKEHGGDEEAPTPKELLLNAMMGCTAMDVVAILKKMKQEISDFKMEIEVEKTTAHPIHFKKAELIFLLNGLIEEEKAIKAVDSSLTRYCGVNYMISKTCDISYRIILNDKKIKESAVQFKEAH